MKCGTVAIIGRPSSGKSTMVNTIVEMPVSITARTPQTTRNAIRGIYTDQRGQLIFTDTPGYHLNDQTLNLRLQTIAVESLKETDMILYMVDATRAPGKEELAIVEIVKKTRRPIVVCLNKCDLARKDKIEESRYFIAENIPDATVLEASAKKDDGIDEILIKLFSLAPEGEMLYPADSYTDQPVEFRISEIIRGKTIALVSQELPHAIYVEVSDLEQRPEDNEIWIRAFIIVERESQKGIIVGKGGANIKKIRVSSFKEIKPIFPDKKLQLDLRVKAQPKWRKNSFVLDKLLN
ncbi:MAG: GTPase Era [Sphaerochaetaceae bacterium]|jgi:GTP-binding protein Era|nr:GTPase Era [Sphaerochaetaceae bacterium]